MKNPEENHPVFAFPFNRNLNEAEKESLLGSVNVFLKSWNSHGQPMKARAWLEESRFLLIGLQEGMPGGCSKDKLFRGLEEINQIYGLCFEGFGNFFVLWNGEIRKMSRNELKDNIIKPEFADNALLFPVWISTGSDYFSLWKKPVSSFSFL